MPFVTLKCDASIPERGRHTYLTDPEQPVIPVCNVRTVPGDMTERGCAFAGCRGVVGGPGIEVLCAFNGDATVSPLAAAPRAELNLVHCRKVGEPLARGLANLAAEAAALLASPVWSKTERRKSFAPPPSLVRAPLPFPAQLPELRPGAPAGSPAMQYQLSLL